MRDSSPLGFSPTVVNQRIERRELQFQFRKERLLAKVSISRILTER